MLKYFFLPTVDNDKNINVHNTAELGLFTWYTFNLLLLLFLSGNKGLSNTSCIQTQKHFW